VYIQRNATLELVPSSSPSLNGLGASSSALDSVASSLGTSSQNLLLMVGAGAVAGWLVNDLVSNTGRKVKRARRKLSRTLAERKERRAAAAAAGGGAVNAAKMMLIGGVAVGVVWFFASRISIAKTGANQ
jgi:hypothetical protein